MKNLLLLLLAFGLITTYANADQITLASDDWCPINCVPGSENQGFMVDIATIVFKKAGHTVVYKKVPWERALAQTRKGKYSAVIGAYHGDAPDFIFPKNEQGMIGNAFFTAKSNSWRYKGISSLNNLKLGVIKGYDYGEDINKYIKDNPKSPAVQLAFGDTPLELNIKKLMKSRIDVLLESEYVFNYKINQMGLKDKIKFAGILAAPDKAFIAFSPVNKMSKEYAEILSSGMDSIRNSGELKKILAKYGLEDWK